MGCVEQVPDPRSVTPSTLKPDPCAQARREDERELTLLGVAAMHDPPRPQVPAAVGTCRAAGIRVIVVTGAPLFGKFLGRSDCPCVSDAVTDACPRRNHDKVLGQVSLPMH